MKIWGLKEFDFIQNLICNKQHFKREKMLFSDFYLYFYVLEIKSDFCWP